MPPKKTLMTPTARSSKASQMAMVMRMADGDLLRLMAAADNHLVHLARAFHPLGACCRRMRPC